MNRRQRQRNADMRVNPTSRLRAAKTSREQLRHEFKGVTPTSALPVTYNDGVRAQDAQVSAPNRRDLQLYREGDRKVCGNCKHFDLEGGRVQMVRERFLERIVLEQEWALRHLGVKQLDELGVCRDRDGTMATGFMSKACPDGYREKRS